MTGSSSVDEAAITGESVPRDCGVGDAVFAGTQKHQRAIGGPGQQAGVGHDAGEDRGAGDGGAAQPDEGAAADRPHRSDVLGVRDCRGGAGGIQGRTFCSGLPGRRRRGEDRGADRGQPVRLIIATPVAYLAAIAAAGAKRVLVKGGSYLEAIAHARTFVFDKTGTLTTGKMRLTDVDTRNGVTEEEAYALAGAVEGASNHPLAVAVSRAVKQRGLSIPTVQRYEAVPGIGVSGEVEGRQVWIGRPEAAAKVSVGGSERPLGEKRSHASRR